MRAHPARRAGDAFALALTAVIATLAPSIPHPGATATAAGDVVDAAALDTLLARHLHHGRVDYGGLAADRAWLDAFLAATASAAPDSFSRDGQIAFWVNTYNARVLAGVIDRPGLESVLDPGKVLGIPTLAFFREKRVSAGRALSLNDIEHRILRGEFHDPRVHFVLNCASKSCPALPERALAAASLDSILDQAARRFLADPAKNRIAADRRLELSSIFKWYERDFVGAAGSVQAYVARYWPDGSADLDARRIRFLPYDWSLNGTWE